MTFSSLTFLFLFFPITFLLYAVIRNHTARNLFSTGTWACPAFTPSP